MNNAAVSPHFDLCSIGSLLNVRKSHRKASEYTHCIFTLGLCSVFGQMEKCTGAHPLLLQDLKRLMLWCDCIEQDYTMIGINESFILIVLTSCNNQYKYRWWKQMRLQSLLKTLIVSEFVFYQFESGFTTRKWLQTCFTLLSLYTKGMPKTCQRWIWQRRSCLHYAPITFRRELATHAKHTLRFGEWFENVILPDSTAHLCRGEHHTTGMDFDGGKGALHLPQVWTPELKKQLKLQEMTNVYNSCHFYVPLWGVVFLTVTVYLWVTARPCLLFTRSFSLPKRAPLSVVQGCSVTISKHFKMSSVI